MGAIPERLRDVSCTGAIQIDIIFIFTLHIFAPDGVLPMFGAVSKI